MSSADPVCWSWPVPEEIGDGEAELLAWHDDRCGICGGRATGRGRHRDHDHVTGLLRGLLCRGCNLHEGHCRAATCVCVKWRARNAATILGISVAFKGTDNSLEGQYRRQGKVFDEAERRAAMRRCANVLGSWVEDGLPDVDGAS